MVFYQIPRSTYQVYSLKLIQSEPNCLRPKCCMTMHEWCNDPGAKNDKLPLQAPPRLLGNFCNGHTLHPRHICLEQTDKAKTQALTKVSLIPTAPSERATRKVEARKMKVVAIEIIPVFPWLLIYVPAAWFASFLEDWFLYGGFVAPVQWPAVVGTWAPMRLSFLRSPLYSNVWHKFLEVSNSTYISRYNLI